MDIQSTVLRQASQEEMTIIQFIAGKVYGPTYLEILGQQQVNYMLGKLYSTSALWELMDQGHIFLIAQIQQQDVGFVTFNCTNAGKGIFKLQKLYVLPEMQGSGMGAFLVKEVIARVQQLEGKLLQLNVNRFNRARGFYEKLGFRVTEEVDIPIGEGYYMNDYVMEMVLEGERPFSDKLIVI